MNFSETAAKELHAVVEQLRKDGMRGLIIDLRNNPGGLLSAAVDICKMFLTEGRIVSTKGAITRKRFTMLFPARRSCRPSVRWPF